MHWHTAQLHKSLHCYGNTMRASVCLSECVCGGWAALLNPPSRDLISPKSSHFSSIPPSPSLRRSSLSVCTSIPAPQTQSWTSQRGVRSFSPASPCSQRSIWTRLTQATMWRPAARQMWSTTKTHAKLVSPKDIYLPCFDKMQASAQAT